MSSNRAKLESGVPHLYAACLKIKIVLEMILCFANAITKIFKCMGGIIFFKISMTSTFKMFVTFYKPKVLRSLEKRQHFFSFGGNRKELDCPLNGRTYFR